MMKSFAKLSLLALFVGIGSQAFAMRYMGSNGGGSGMSTNNNTTAQESRAAACAPATGLRDLEYNNVRARIETGGSMW